MKVAVYENGVRQMPEVYGVGKDMSEAVDDCKKRWAQQLTVAWNVNMAEAMEIIREDLMTFKTMAFKRIDLAFA